MEYCMRQGAKGMLIANPAIQSGFYGVPFAMLSSEERTSVTSRIQESPVYATFDCSNAKCPCWNRVKNTARLPAAGLSLKQYGEVRAAVAAAMRDRRQFVGTVESKVGARVRQHHCFRIAQATGYCVLAALCSRGVCAAAYAEGKGGHSSCHGHTGRHKHARQHGACLTRVHAKLLC
jgi:hypothetical protein